MVHIGGYHATASPQVKVKCLCYSIYFARNYNVNRFPQRPMLINRVGIRNHVQVQYITLVKNNVTTTILCLQWSGFQELCTETPVQRTPGTCRDTDTCLCRGLSHLLFPYSSVAEVCKGPHMFHPILRQRSTMCLKSPNLHQ